MKRILRITAAVLSLLLVAAFAGCGSEPPPDDGTKEPPALSGSFVCEGYGGFVFDGDGKSVRVEANRELAEETGLPEGFYDGEYVFLFDGGLWRYDKADTVRITADGETYRLSTVPGGTNRNSIELLTKNGEHLVFNKE